MKLSTVLTIGEIDSFVVSLLRIWKEFYIFDYFPESHVTSLDTMLNTLICMPIKS